MRAINQGFRVQARQALHVHEHLFRRPFEQAAAPHGEKRVSNEDQRLVRHVIGNMPGRMRSEEHTSELQSLMRISYAVFCLQKKRKKNNIINNNLITITQEGKITKQPKQ